MKALFIITISYLFILISCENSSQKSHNIEIVSNINNLVRDSSKNVNQMEEVLKTIPKNITAVLGNRFVISGDFDGDKKKEKLTEHFFSSLDNKETNKFYNNLANYDQLIALTIKKSPYSFLISENKIIDSLHIASTEQLLGLSFLKNEGDLNEDGTDEISYVIDWADWSNLNTFHLATYKNKKWIELYTFPIWDWQIPNHDGFHNNSESANKDITLNSSTNKIIVDKKKIKSFEGLIKKIKKNRIQIIFRNEEAEIDTMQVDLK
jgi:hypothetical protein